MKRLIIIAAVAAVVLFTAAPAQAWISKREAHGYAVKAVRGLFADVAAESDTLDSWWIESARRGDRIDGNRVEFDYEFYYDFADGPATYFDAVRVINVSSTRYRVRWPYEGEWSS